MTRILTGENSSYIEFEAGTIEFMADGGCNEREFHNGTLNEDETKQLYEAMKAYYERVETEGIE